MTELESANDATSIIAERLHNHNFPEDSSWLIDILFNKLNESKSRETEVWDYKKDWPFSYSDDYFRSIVKHIIGFANTSGGLLIFGIDDESRKPVPSTVRTNLDKLCRALKDIVVNPPEIDLREHTFEDSRKINILIVFPTTPSCLPASFQREYADKHDISQYWVRSGHETIQAQAKHIPLLFCGSERFKKIHPSLDYKLPPSPSRIKQFVGRLDTMSKVFSWLHLSNEPRAFLYGRGGSGKTTIAYELAKSLKFYGKNIIMDNGGNFDGVLFLSAKEKELSTETGKIQKYSKDFGDELTLYQAIICESNLSETDDPFNLSLDEAKAELIEIFNTVSLLIVIDDIDTLTTKKIDPGSESLFRLLIKGEQINKVLYTMRNAQSHAIHNSIEVPGLRVGKEYQRFVEVCCKQFSVEMPSENFLNGEIASVTERRPLIIESIIALRRNAGSYKKAIQLFEENIGVDARDYVFQREWNALPSNNNARNFLCALSIYNKPASFDDMVAILQNSKEVVLQAVADCREMFLDVQITDEESIYSLGNLTRSFIFILGKELDKYTTIEARVNAFRKAHLPNNPALSKIIMSNTPKILRAKNKIDFEAINQVWNELNSTRLPPKILEDPRFREFRGYAALFLEKPDFEQARSDFRFAFAMKHEPNISYLKAWHWAEKTSGHGGKACEEIEEFVGSARAYSGEDKADFIAKEASRYYMLGLEERYINPLESIKYLEKSVLLHTRNVAIAYENGFLNLYKWEKYLRNSWLIIFQTCLNNSDIDPIIDALVKATKLKPHSMDLTADAIKEYFLLLVQKTPLSKKTRLKGRVNYLHECLSKATWDSDYVKNEVTAQISRVLSSIKD